MRLSQSWKLAVGAAVHEAAAFPFAAGIEPSLVTDAGFVAAEAKVQVAAAEETATSAVKASSKPLDPPGTSLADFFTTFADAFTESNETSTELPEGRNVVTEQAEEEATTRSTVLVTAGAML